MNQVTSSSYSSSIDWPLLSDSASSSCILLLGNASKSFVHTHPIHLVAYNNHNNQNLDQAFVPICHTKSM